MILGALEAGGTKMVCAIGDENGQVIRRASFPTLTPQETLPELIAFFQEAGIEALGIGCFGPLELNRNADDYGYITTTPKIAWQNTALLPAFRDALNIPVEIDTDVNGAAYGEALLGAGKGCSNLVYFTIGTGIGGGCYTSGQLLHGMLHPEMGHMLLRPMGNDPTPEGFCPFHKGCLEGLASGPAIEKRWKMKAYELPADHEAWELEADYLAQMCMNTIVTLSPEKIVLGGGVMHQSQLFPMIREKTKALLNGYIRTTQTMGSLENYIVPPELGDNAGICGALLLARDAKTNAGGTQC